MSNNNNYNSEYGITNLKEGGEPKPFIDDIELTTYSSYTGKPQTVRYAIFREFGRFLGNDEHSQIVYSIYPLLKTRNFKVNTDNFTSRKVSDFLDDTIIKGTFTPEQMKQIEKDNLYNQIHKAEHRLSEPNSRGWRFSNNKKGTTKATQSSSQKTNTKATGTKQPKYLNAWNHYASMHGGKRKTRRSKKTVKRKHKKTHKRRAH